MMDLREIEVREPSLHQLHYFPTYSSSLRRGYHDSTHTYITTADCERGPKKLKRRMPIASTLGNNLLTIFSRYAFYLHERRENGCFCEYEVPTTASVPARLSESYSKMPRITLEGIPRVSMKCDFCIYTQSIPDIYESTRLTDDVDDDTVVASDEDDDDDESFGFPLEQYTSEILSSLPIILLAFL